MIMTLINYVYSCRPGPMRPGGFVDLCEHCTKILDERNLESEEYIKKKKKKKKKCIKYNFNLINKFYLGCNR